MDNRSTQKSPQTSLEQTGQPNYMGSFAEFELSQAIVPLPQGYPNETDLHFRAQQPDIEFQDPTQNINQAAGAFVEHVTPYRGDDDLLSIYLTGISQPNDPNVFQGNQLPVSDNAMIPMDNRVINSHFNVSTIPTEFHMPRPSFRPEGQGFGTSTQLPAPSGLLQDNLIFSNMLHSNRVAAQQTYPADSMMYGLPQRSQPIPQENPNFMNVPNVLNQGSGSTYYGNTFLPAGTQSSTLQGSTISQQKRKLFWQDVDNAPNNKRMSSILWGDQGQSSRSSNERFTLYDKRYEEIGLPIDPHLRVFNAGTGN